jgi:N-methylhydantoinase A
MHRVAIDIGGTFTDLVAVEETGAITLAKADSTPGKLEEGVVAAFDRSGVRPANVSALVHGTTVVVNAITERSGVPTALITTRGFRDVLEIGRGNRPDLYNLSYEKPKPFVPRRLRFEVRERMSYRGQVIEALADDDVRSVASAIRETGVRAVAVAFLHAWANPVHERLAVELLSDLLPGVDLVASHEVSGQWREYERTSTAVLSAYVKPVVRSYLRELRDRLAAEGVRGPVYVMRSGGGVSSIERARAQPIHLLESGPVAGVAAAAEVGRRMGAPDVLALDIGGTTAKTSAVLRGRLRVEHLHHIERTPRFAGYPVQAPVVEIVEIGAGGGSIAWTDAAGGLHVGPRSAGAEPGPACYGRGGVDPTITDANLVAGRLDPEYFLGGAMTLDPLAATDALARLGKRLDVGPEKAARGVLRYAVAQMAGALRMVTVRRGHDPRDFAFVAYGGAGPLHATLIARELGIRRTIVPPAPGHFSALGMLLGRLRADAVRTHVAPLEPAALSALFVELEKEATAELEAPGEGVEIHRFAHLRYSGQEHTLEVELGGGPVDDRLLARLRADFDRRSEEEYAFKLEAPVEVVAGRVAASVAGDPIERWGEATEDRAFSPREVDFDQHGGVVTTDVLARLMLRVGERERGPCVIQEHAATTLVLPGQLARKDDEGNLIVEEEES